MGRHIDVIVSAACSGMGKTMLCCEIARRAAGAGLSCFCCKLSRGGHAPAGFSEGAGSEGSDTWRYVEAGASRALVAGYSDPSGLAGLVRGLPVTEDLAVWESNSAASVIEADCLVYIRSKDSGIISKNPELASGADILLEGPLDATGASVAADSVFDLVTSGRGRRSRREGRDA